MKFSIVVPVYNVEKYLRKCLESIQAQTYQNYEVVVVNDGSKDNSELIIKEFTNEDKRFKYYSKKNGGLSDARNYGIKKATGDYIIFVDSDDYIDSLYLESINKILVEDSGIDVLKTELILVNEEGKLLRKEKLISESSYVDFSTIISSEFVEPACCYAYKHSFWEKNGFQYTKGKVHEDFGLTPEVLVKAKKIYYLDFYSYYYVQRPNSIMSSNTNEMLLKKAYDMLEQYDRLISLRLNVPSKVEKTYKSFLANAVISKSNTLSGLDKKKYVKELKDRKVVDYLLDDNLKRKIKKIIFKFRFRSW